MFMSTCVKPIRNMCMSEYFQSWEHIVNLVYKPNLIRLSALNELFVRHLHYHLGFFKWDPKMKSGFTATLRVEGHTARETIRKSAGSHPGC